MPDLLVHATVGCLVVFRDKYKYLIPSIVLLGCIFPDLIRGPLLLAGNLESSLGIKLISSEVAFILKLFHSPIPLALQVWLFCFLFERELRLKVFVSFFLAYCSIFCSTPVNAPTTSPTYGYFHFRSKIQYKAFGGQMKAAG